jgi:hypothetical protein
MNLKQLTPLRSGALGLLIGLVSTYTLSPLLSEQEWWPGHTEHNHSSGYHIHADFLLVSEDTIIDLSHPEYMSTAEKVLADDVHLHDEDGTVIHYHAEGITFATFLASLGITLTDTCLTLPEKGIVCSDENTEVVLYVNNTRYEKPITSYISEDLDRVLLYAGKRDKSKQAEFLNQVADRACIFSGSCPERGIAPGESCGLTCEL